MTHRGKIVFGLDIGTRSIVGTVGYKAGDRFVIMSQHSKEHETRAMLDGQIHDIKKVSGTIQAVKEKLERDIGFNLTEVCIAAAGRVLRTVTTHVEADFEQEKVIREEDVYALSAQGIEQAFAEFLSGNDTELKFYCVGYSVIRYFMNHYPIGNPEEHKASNIGADMIVTFLPEDVVDGLYKAVELAGLKVANLTLEPIAAIEVAIPEKFRMLNIALVDVGAGTSDISITRDGAIEAYGMIPVAGDGLTEVIAQHCLVDFNTAEQIKRQMEEKEEISYEDIMGLPQTITRTHLLELLETQITAMTKPVAECIKELNGNRTVSAVFVVGGGGKIPGYTERLAKELELVPERVALRGKEVLGFVDFPEGIEKSSLLVTPIGICLNFYEQNNNFVFVTFNNSRIKVYDNGKLSVVDVAMQADFPNDGLFPKRGKELNFTVDEKPRMKRGDLGEAAVITVNGETADIHTPIKANDVIAVKPSTAGEAAKMEVRSLPEFHQSITVIVNGKRVTLPKFASVNGALESGYYEIREGDCIRMQSYYTVAQLLEFLDVALAESTTYYVNHEPAVMDTPVYENFMFEWKSGDAEAAYEEMPEEEMPEEEMSEEEMPQEAAQDTSSSEQESAQNEIHDIVVSVGGVPVRMTGKKSYIYVDIFDFIDFDLSKPKGSIVTKLNGQPAEYMKEVKDGDVIEIYWE